MTGYHTYSDCCTTPSDRPYVYSVDMMMAYVNLFKHPVVKIDISELLPQLILIRWNNSALLDVLKDLNKNQTHYKRIMDADLSYPIFVRENNDLIDGAHRLCKAILTGKKTINAYVFNKSLMKKFIIHEGFTADHKVDNAGASKKELYEILMLFHKRFCN